MKKLSPTSYALLGLLAVKPWSAYELTLHMRRSIIRAIWPRAESKLYEEPKNLVAHGLATCSRERRGGRVRAVYAITAKGRAALGDWLDEPGAGPALEFEAMLKIASGDHGNRAQLLATIDRIRQDAVNLGEAMRPLFERWLAEGPTFPERLHITAITGRFAYDLMKTVRAWAEWAEQVVDDWPSTKLDETMAERSRQILLDVLKDLPGARKRQPTRAARGGPAM